MPLRKLSIPGGGRRARKACQRCKMKEAKCDDSYPCQRCRIDDEVCVFSSPKRSNHRNRPRSEGYVDMLERQQQRLSMGLRAMFWEWKRAQAQSPCSQAPGYKEELQTIEAEEEVHDSPSIHDILTALNCNVVPMMEEEEECDEDESSEECGGAHDPPPSNLHASSQEAQAPSSNDSSGASTLDQPTGTSPWTPGQFAPDWTNSIAVLQRATPAGVFDMIDWDGACPDDGLNTSKQPGTSLSWQMSKGILPLEDMASHGGTAYQDTTDLDKCMELDTGSTQQMPPSMSLPHLLLEDAANQGMGPFQDTTGLDISTKLDRGPRQQMPELTAMKESPLITGMMGQGSAASQDKRALRAYSTHLSQLQAEQRSRLATTGS